MNESQAWLEISIAYDTSPEDRSEEQRYLTTTGICKAINDLCCDNEITHEVWESMRGKMNRYAMENDLSGYWWPSELYDPEDQREYDKKRSEWCLEKAGEY